MLTIWCQCKSKISSVYYWNVVLMALAGPQFTPDKCVTHAPLYMSFLSVKGRPFNTWDEAMFFFFLNKIEKDCQVKFQKGKSLAEKSLFSRI